MARLRRLLVTAAPMLFTLAVAAVKLPRPDTFGWW
jgi:hypothetical protein